MDFAHFTCFEVAVRAAIEQIKMYVCIVMHGCKITKSFETDKENGEIICKVRKKSIFASNSGSNRCHLRQLELQERALMAKNHEEIE
jgi:hypothetical protein